MHNLSEDKFVYYGDSNEIVLLIALLNRVSRMFAEEEQTEFVLEGIRQVSEKLEAAYAPGSPNAVNLVQLSFSEIGFLIRMLLRAADLYDPALFKDDPGKVLESLAVRTEISNLSETLMSCKRSDGKSWDSVY